MTTPTPSHTPAHTQHPTPTPTMSPQDRRANTWLYIILILVFAYLLWKWYYPSTEKVTYDFE